MNSTKIIIENWPKKPLFLRWLPVLIAALALFVSFYSIYISRQGIIISNAPYLTYSISVNGRLMANKILSVDITWKNVGKTPAINFQPLTVIAIEKYGEQISDLTPHENSADGTNGNLYPNDATQLNIQSKISFNDEIISAINTGSLICVIKSIVQYKDLFGRKYVVSYRDVYDPQTNFFTTDCRGNKYQTY